MSSDSNKPSIFDILKDPTGELSNLEQEYLGPDYSYYKKIKTPAQMGMGTRGTFNQLATDIDGLVNYVEVLITGRSKAQTKPIPLGDRFFLKTGAQCKSSDGTLHDRHIYVDNIPYGNIPIISSALGTNFTEFEGLVPGAIEKMNDLNPMHFMKAFMVGSEPPCSNITLSTVDVNDNASFASNYITDSDARDINPCNFKNKINTVSGDKCQEGFQQRSLLDFEKIFNRTDRPALVLSHRTEAYQAIIKNTYYGSLTILLCYLLYKLITKKSI